MSVESPRDGPITGAKDGIQVDAAGEGVGNGNRSSGTRRGRNASSFESPRQSLREGCRRNSLIWTLELEEDEVMVQIQRGTNAEEVLKSFNRTKRGVRIRKTLDNYLGKYKPSASQAGAENLQNHTLGWVCEDEAG